MFHRPVEHRHASFRDPLTIACLRLIPSVDFRRTATFSRRETYRLLAGSGLVQMYAYMLTGKARKSRVDRKYFLNRTDVVDMKHDKPGPGGTVRAE